MSDSPSDAGLQPERTLLSWRRTCLALVLGSLIAVRFTVEELGVVGLLLGVVGVLLATGAYLSAGARYRRAHDDLRIGAGLSADAVPLALMTATVVVLGVASAVYVVAHGVL